MGHNLCLHKSHPQHLPQLWQFSNPAKLEQSDNINIAAAAATSEICCMVNVQYHSSLLVSGLKGGNTVVSWNYH